MKYNPDCRAKDSGGQGFLLISQSTFFRAIDIFFAIFLQYD